MDLIEFRARIKEMEEFVTRMEAEQAAALAAEARKYVEPRIKNLNALLTQTEWDDFEKIRSRHFHKFNTHVYNIAQFVRVLLQHFVMHWETMPMLEARKREEELREQRHPRKEK